MSEKITSRKQQALDTKNNIYNSALSLFKIHGFDKVTIEMIVKESGVSTGSFYTYFKSKEAIFIEFFSRIDSYYDESIAKSKPEDSNEQIILNLLRAMNEFVEQQLGVEGISVVYYKQLYDFGKNRDLTARNRSFFKHLTNYVEKGVACGEFRSDLPINDIVDIIVRLAHGLVFDWCIYNGSFDILNHGDEWFKEAFSIIRNTNNK